jgi:hypothetical protein
VSPTPPVLLLALAFPLLIMAGMLLMGGVEKRLTGSRARLSLVSREPAATDVAAPAPAGLSAAGLSPAALSPAALSPAALSPVALSPVAASSADRPRPTLTGPFLADAATTPLRYSLPSVTTRQARTAGPRTLQVHSVQAAAAPTGLSPAAVSSAAVSSAAVSSATVHATAGVHGTTVPPLHSVADGAAPQGHHHHQWRA